MKKLNALAKEKSPYLLQHAGNPVDWHPWCPEAFEKARLENKMIFLSIGYSTCHWCHVMERESFENERIAGLLNRDFISIKVDREERPDIDHIYMAAVQTLTGSGGWPLSVFLTPEGNPVTGGTYFPPEDRWGRAGMSTLLPRLAAVWKEKRGEAETAGKQLSQFLSRQSNRAGGELDEAVLTNAFEQFSSHFDSDNGGFGDAPKFPRCHDLSFLLRYWKRTQDTSALEIVEFTLDKMAGSGLRDQLGDGFHRYSTDARWIVPHFEKMLYDQAIIATAYLEAYQATHKESYSAVARGVFDYVLRDMTSPEGGFYSAEDADSEGEEGTFYVWRPEEIVQLLGPETGKIFNHFFTVTDTGNFEKAASVLHTSGSMELFAQAHGLDSGKLEKLLAVASKTLFEARKKRPAPYKDDKILTAWNGLMISAMALGGRVLNQKRYTDAAINAANFVLKFLKKDGRLLRRYREKESAVAGFHDDYAFFSAGLLELYETTLDVQWLDEAKCLADQMLDLFWDHDAGGFFYTPGDGEKLIARTKEYYDGAIPSGNSVAALFLLKLSRMTGHLSYDEKARQILASGSESLKAQAMGFPALLMALDFALGPVREIVVAGGAQWDGFVTMKEILFQRFSPKDVWIHHDPGVEGARIRNLAEFANRQLPVSGKATVYVCRNYQCEKPVTDAGELRRLLSSG